MRAVYRVGTRLFLIDVTLEAELAAATAWRRADDGRLARVVDATGTPFRETAPGLYQAMLRASARLARTLGASACQVRDADLRARGRAGTWCLAPRIE